MAVTFPTLDLGELTKGLEDAYLADAAPEAAAVDAAPVVDGESADPPVAAAEAAPPVAPEVPDTASDDAYRARFEADYQERSKADFGKLRASLDRQANDWRQKATVAGESHEEAVNYAAFLEDKLAEYDPDEVARYRKNREAHLTTRERQRSMKELDLENRRVLRDREFRKLYPDLDPDEPALVEAFVAGDYRLEAARIAALQAQAELGKARRTPAAPAVAKGPAASPSAPVLARDESGRFLARAEQTRQVEAARGAESVSQGRGGGFPAKAPTTLEEGRKALDAGFARLGIPRS